MQKMQVFGKALHSVIVIKFLINFVIIEHFNAIFLIHSKIFKQAVFCVLRNTKLQNLLARCHWQKWQSVVRDSFVFWG